MPIRVPSSARSLPNLVASWTRSRRPISALPTSRSLVKGPYMSAVSRKVTPEVDGTMDGGEAALLVG